MEWCLSISTSKYMDMIVRIKHRKSEQAFFHVKPITTIPILCIYFSRPSWIETWPSLGTTSEKKSKKWDIGPISLDLYPPTINRDIFDFIFPPTLLIKIGTFLKKNCVPSSFLMTISYISLDFDPFTGASHIKAALFDAAWHLNVINVMCVMKSWIFWW